jgi:SSS family solute:Na+ symporter
MAEILQFTTLNYVFVWLIFAAYLIFLAVAGIYAKRKTKTLTDFMVAGRSIGPLLLGISFGVTYFSAVMVVGGGEYSWNWGLATLWIAGLNVLVGVVATFIFFGKRTRALGEHFDCMTVPQLLGRRYQDTRVQTFSAVVQLIFQTIYVISIYMGLATLLSVIIPTQLFQLAFIITTSLAGIITIIYLNVGGSHGAIFTDAVESIIILAGILAVFIAGIIAIGGVTGLISGLRNIELASGIGVLSFSTSGLGGLTTFPGNSGLAVVGMVSITSFGVWSMPQMISRFYTAKKGRKTMRWGLVISAVWAFIAAIFAWFNGSISRVFFSQKGAADTPLWDFLSLFNNINAFQSNPTGFLEAYLWKSLTGLPRTPESYLAGAFIQEFFSYPVSAKTSIPYLMLGTLPPVIAGLVMAAVTAASLTTGEKIILMASSSFSIDVYQERTGVSDDKTLRMTRIISTIVVAIGVIGAIFSLIYDLAAILALCMFAWAAMCSVIMVPYILGLFWRKGTAKAALISGAIGLTVAVVQYVFLYGGGHALWFGNYPSAWLGNPLEKLHPFLASIPFSIILFIVISIIDKEGAPPKEFLDKIFTVMEEEEPLIEETEYKEPSTKDTKGEVGKDESRLY